MLYKQSSKKTSIFRFRNNSLILEKSVTSWNFFSESRALKENTYPFLALIVLRQNRMTVAARIEGPIGPGELIEKLERILQDNEASLIAARAEREERDFTQTLRREQDAAILNSLKADQEKVK
nr:FAS-associated factor 2-like [Crassostrea gigas]